jgi:hypothetical protein
MGDGPIFFKNLRASSFNDDLSIDTAFSQQHLAGQYRSGTFKVLAKSSEQFTFLRNIFWQKHKCCKSTAQRCSWLNIALHYFSEGSKRYDD